MDSSTQSVRLSCWLAELRTLRVLCICAQCICALRCIELAAACMRLSALVEGLARRGGVGLWAALRGLGVVCVW